MSIGVGIVTSEQFAKQDQRPFYNYSYRSKECIEDSTIELSKKAEYEIGRAIARVLNENGVEIQSLITKQNNQAIMFLKEDMNSDRPMMITLFYIILVVMAFVFAILGCHVIEKESVIIGTLLSNGYKKGEILYHYMFLPILVATISAVIGNFLGYSMMLKPFKSLYYNTYSLPNCELKFNLEAFVLTTIVPILMIILINYVIMLRALSISPLRFLRRDIKRTGRRSAVKLPSLSFLKRFRLRVIIQNASNYITLFLGIFMASFLLLFAIAMLPMVDDYVDDMDKTLLADYQYILNEPVEVTEGQKATMLALSFYDKEAEKYKEVSFYGMDEFNGEKLTKEQVIFSDILLEVRELKKNTEVEFVNEYTEEQYHLAATDSIVYSGGMIVVMERSRLNEMFGYDLEYFNGYFSDKKLDIDESKVMQVITVDDVKKIAEQMIDSIAGMIPMIVIVSIIIYLVLMYILTKLAVDKNAMNISLMKVFGYRDKEIRRLYLNAGTMVVVLSLIISIPLENLGVSFLTQEMMKRMGIYLEVNIPRYLYVEVAFIGLISFLIINTIHIFRVKKIPMTEALKNRE